MPQPEMDRTVTDVTSMDRDTLTQAILEMDCNFPVDFTAKQLRSLTLEKLRHVYLALQLHQKSTRSRSAGDAG